MFVLKHAFNMHSLQKMYPLYFLKKKKAGRPFLYKKKLRKPDNVFRVIYTYIYIKR